MDNTVAELLRHKGSEVHTIGRDAMVIEAARAMNERRIGSLVVVDGERPVGIITERDILTRVVAQARPPATTPVREVMTDRILTCTPRTPLDEVRQVMRERRIRHLPVIDGDRLAGMVSIGDLNTAQTRSLTETIQYLEAYIRT